MNFISQLFASYTKRRKERLYIKRLKEVIPPNFSDNSNSETVSFSHIGLIGDIVYSIPCMLALAKGRKISLYLDITQDSGYKRKLKHYNKGKMLTKESVAFLSPLILSNPQFINCGILTGQKIDYDLNAFRKYPFDYRMGHICRWYFLTFAVSYDLSKPWLFVNPNTSVTNTLVIARSFRYRTPCLDYSFLRNYSNIGFVGLPDEYQEMRLSIPHLTYLPVDNALQLAEIIAGCRFFIGNQSFPFSIAEALKVKRILEIHIENPNVIVDGINGFDFCYQPQFEKIVHSLFNTQSGTI
jgi:hypothetical protein